MPERPAGAGLYWAASSDRPLFVVKHHACQADWSRLTRMQVVQEDASADMSAGESIGQRLRRLRLEKGLSQRELAGPGVSYAYVSRIEGGQRRPSLRAIRVLARKLGVSAQYLETGSMTTNEEEREIRLSDAELRLRLDESVAGAEDAFHEVLREATEAGDVYITLGNTYLDLDRPEQAAELYERCLDELSAQEEDDTTARVRFGTHLSYALSNLGRFGEAREVLNDLTSRASGIVDTYARIRLYWSLARLAAMEGHGRTVLRHLRRAIALLEATEGTLHLARAHLLSSEILILDGRAEDAAPHLEAAERLFDLGGDARDLGAVRAQQAKRAALLGDHEEALRQATESLRLTGDAPLGSAHFALAQAHALRGAVDEANGSFRTAVELLDQGGDWREAVQAADLAEKASASPRAFL